ncbi:alpha-L-rhamnosidase C-terminal domain-containing protein [Rhodopirellula bahusiensis]|uniref:alpha-L-rhamnosidase C-terminal domain-containing protein n=1 Tax=Rhodopirellula bahusiensis TaxID=2014065 RepID=UPI003267F89D
MKAEAASVAKHGPIHVDWSRESGFKLSAELPEGITANLDLPELGDMQSVSVNGSPVSVTKKQNRWVLDGEFSGSILVEAN